MLATADIFLLEDFRLDRQGDGLSRCNERGVFVPVAIGLRALDILSVLVGRSGDLVSKEEIMTAVWGRTVSPACARPENRKNEVSIGPGSAATLALSFAPS